MAEYTNGCAECREKLKSELKEVIESLSIAMFETSSETAQAFYIMLQNIRGRMPDKEDDDTK